MNTCFVPNILPEGVDHVFSQPILHTALVVEYKHHCSRKTEVQIFVDLPTSRIYQESEVVFITDLCNSKVPVLLILASSLPA